MKSIRTSSQKHLIYIPERSIKTPTNLILEPIPPNTHSVKSRYKIKSEGNLKQPQAPSYLISCLTGEYSISRSLSREIPKKVRFCNSQFQNKEKISASNILQSIRAQIPRLLEKHESSRLYLGFNQKSHIEKNQDYYLKLLNRPQENVKDKRSIENMRRKARILNELKTKF